MKKYFNLLIIGTLSIVLFSSFIQLDAVTVSQSTVDSTGNNQVEECGTDEIIRRNPFLMEKYTSRVACAPEVDLDTAQVLTIPVVVHVVHLGEPVGEGTNISDEQVLSCIENLNHRFRGDVEALAALTDEYDEYELSLVMDSKVEFCLAQRDPDNNPTNGIHRYNGSELVWENYTNNPPTIESYAEDGVTNSNISDGINESYMKETVGCWDTQKYFNLWVVSEINGNNGGNGIQGYSYLGPTGNNCLFGPVCLYNVFGTTGNLKSSHNLNATTTHEVGHALGLWHTFSNQGSNPCSETNGCTQGDQCPDTPPTSTNNTGCTPVDCPDAMIQNYMDYTPQTCRTAFTQNQIERMRDQIWNDMTGLVYDNVNCQSLNALDLAITSVSLPLSWCRPIVDFNVKVSNYGGNNVDGAQLLVNGQSTELGTIAAGESVTIIFTDYPVGDGTFNFEVAYAQDQYLENNTYTHVITIEESNWLEVIISPDVWSNEINWEITDEFGELKMEGGGYPFGSEDIDFYEGACLTDGCYTFKITDSNGDGMCAWDFDNDGICDGYMNAFINILSNNNLIFDLSQPDEIDFGSLLTHDFCIVNCPVDEYCPEDLSGDGVVEVQDLLIILTYMGMQLEECNDVDLNNDLSINGEDLYIVVQQLGLLCGTDQYVDGMEIPDWVWDYIDSDGDSSTDGISNISTKQPVPVGRPVYYNLSGKVIQLDARAPDGVYIRVQEMSYGPPKIDKIYHVSGI